MNEILNKEPVERVRKKLEEFDKSLKIVLLESTARTAIDAAKSLNTEVGSIVKSLLLRTKSSYLLCLIAGDKKCSLNKLKKILKEKDLSMASANEVKEVTFLSFTNKTLDLPKNVISTGINSTSQLNTIKKFIELNEINLNRLEKSIDMHNLW